MRTTRNHGAAVLAAFLACTCATSACRAQFFIGAGDYDRQLQPGAVVLHDGEPFSHRYGFYAGPSSYFSGDTNHMLYMDYLDRLDRAERFGYRPPMPPAFLSAPRGRCYGR